MITIDASGATSGMDFEAYIRGGFLAGAPGAFPAFDNSMAFSGEEMFLSYGTGESGRFVLIHGQLNYNFPTHTVWGTGNTIEFGTRGTGAFDANGYFVGGNVELSITGLNLFNAKPTSPSEETTIEANGAVHNFASAYMSGAGASQTRLAVFANALDSDAQTFIGSAFDDIFAGTAFGDIVMGGASADNLGGEGGDDLVKGGEGRDTLVGGAGNDKLRAGAGQDDLSGGEGDDKLLGGTGRDHYAGDAGADTFVFNSRSDSGIRPGGRDILDDFSIADGDRIDLSGLGNLSFLGIEEFSGDGAGELRFVQKADATIVQVDIDGDAKFDLSIKIAKSVALDGGDFIL